MGATSFSPSLVAPSTTMNYSDQYILHQIKRLQERVGILEGKVGGIGVNSLSYTYWEDVGPEPSSPPPSLTEAWTVMFRDGAVSRTWDPAALIWR